MHIVVNGEPRDVAQPLTMAALLQALHMDARMVVVEHNRRMLKRAELSTTSIRDHDTIEIVRMVGGGT